MTEIFTSVRSYRAGPGRAEAFLLNPQPLAALTAHEWGVVAEVVPNGKALGRARELADLYLKAPGSDPHATRACISYPALERTHRSRSWLWTVAGRSIVCGSREINASEK